MKITKPYYDILIVDDEEDILQVTKLALKNMEVHGSEIRPICLKSKKEAIEYLKSPKRSLVIALALIDVVMESNTAGLELCSFIRNELGDSSMNLIIRTGQPGVAPEKGVIEEYDIDGYLSKPELTKEKLYTIVKCGIKNFNSKLGYMLPNDFVTGYVDALSKNQGIKSAVDLFMKKFVVDSSMEGMASGMAIFIDGKLITSAGTLLKEEDIKAFRSKLTNAEEVRSDKKGLARKAPGALVWEYGNIIWMVDGALDQPKQIIKYVLDTGFKNLELLQEIEKKLLK